VLLLAGRWRGTTHTTPDVTKLVEKVREQAAKDNLLALQATRTASSRRVRDIFMVGSEKLSQLKKGTLNEFHKRRIAARLKGSIEEREVDELEEPRAAPTEDHLGDDVV
jgi:hypothetical protein